LSKYKSVSEEEFRLLTEPSLRLFLSADLEGSTRLKQKTEQSDGWMGSIALFSIHTKQLFESELQRLTREQNIQKYSCPDIWKQLGDEVVFVHKVQHIADVRILTEAFCGMVETWNDDLAKGKTERGCLRIKGAAWVAGFPVCNTLIATLDEREDYAGPSIDAGFRIANLATPNRFALSVDLCWLLARHGFRKSVYFSGSATLKGLNDVAGYPQLWSLVSKSEYASQELKMERHSKLTEDDLQALCKSFIEEHGVPRHLPFFEEGGNAKQKPKDFDEKLKIVRGFLRSEIYDVRADSEEGDQPSSKDTSDLLQRLQDVMKKMSSEEQVSVAKKKPKKIISSKNPFKKRSSKEAPGD